MTYQLVVPVIYLHLLLAFSHARSRLEKVSRIIDTELSFSVPNDLNLSLAKFCEHLFTISWSANRLVLDCTHGFTCLGRLHQNIWNHFQHNFKTTVLSYYLCKKHSRRNISNEMTQKLNPNTPCQLTYLYAFPLELTAPVSLFRVTKENLHFSPQEESQSSFIHLFSITGRINYLQESSLIHCFLV